MVQKLWRDTISSEWLTCWVIIFHHTRKEACFKDSIGITFEIQLLLYFLLIFFHILIYECVIFRIVAKVVIHVCITLYVISLTIIQMVSRGFTSREFASRSPFAIKFANPSDTMSAWAPPLIFLFKAFQPFLVIYLHTVVLETLILESWIFFTFLSWRIITHILTTAYSFFDNTSHTFKKQRP